MLGLGLGLGCGGAAPCSRMAFCSAHEKSSSGSWLGVWVRRLLGLRQAEARPSCAARPPLAPTDQRLRWAGGGAAREARQSGPRSWSLHASGRRGAASGRAVDQMHPAAPHRLAQRLSCARGSAPSAAPPGSAPPASSRVGTRLGDGTRRGRRASCSWPSASRPSFPTCAMASALLLVWVHALQTCGVEVAGLATNMNRPAQEC
eukprot:scaffold31868_cov67-Phaeocystis_antarctica.AAC.7